MATTRSRSRRTLRAEPRDELYRALIDFASRRCCPEFLLVVRRDVAAVPSCTQTLRRLERFLVEQTDVDEWPGTRLVPPAPPARRHRYALDDGSAGVLAQQANGLFEWRQPALPEGLTLMRTRSEPWLETIAHERYACLHLLDEEREALLAAVPAFAELLSEAAAS